MAASLMQIQPPIIVRACATTSTSISGHQKSDSGRKSWWTPLFGWSSEPDYIDSKNTETSLENNTTTTLSVRSGAVSEPDLDQRTFRSCISPVNFTEEKARKLRMVTKETETFHNAMYHSTIVSRLASDFSDRFGL